MGRGSDTNSQIGDGSAFKGQFEVQGGLRIDGKFEGSISTRETLIIGKTGRVRTNIKARHVIVAGTLIGDISAVESVTLEASGRMLGNIRSPSVQCEPGGVVKGSIEITGGQKKDIEGVVMDSYQGGPPLPGKSSRAGKDESKKKKK